MTRPLPTFSALPRAFACPLSEALPHAQEQSDAAAEGTVRHHFLRRVSDLARAGMTLPRARELALAEAPEDQRWILALIPLEGLRLKGVVAEAALAFDVETGEARILGRGIDRRYDEAGRRPTEIVGSIDRLGLLGEDGVYVGDYKGRSHARRPEEDEQLLAGALTACRVYRRRWAELEVVRIINARPWPVKARVAAPDLERFAGRLVHLGGRVQADRAAVDAGGALPQATTGEHCRYCPALRYCPAKMGLARAALGGDLFEVLRLARAGRPLIDETTAPALREAIADVERLVKTLKADLADYARQAPFRQRDGRMYGLTRTGKVAAHRAPAEVGHA